MKHATMTMLYCKCKGQVVMLLFGMLAGFAFSAQAADDWTLQGPHPWYAGRSHHAMAYAGDDKCVMFAGKGDYDAPCVYDLSQDFCSCGYLNPRPYFRKDHAMAYIRWRQGAAARRLGRRYFIPHDRGYMGIRSQQQHMDGHDSLGRNAL